MTLEDDRGVYLDSGFQHDVFLEKEKGIVIKTPKISNITSETIQKLKDAMLMHEDFVGSWMPDMDITKSDTYGYIIEQQYIPNAKPLPLLTSTNPELPDLLAVGKAMQEEHGILFDILGVEGMFQALAHHLEQKTFTKSIVKPVFDRSIPLSAQVLKKLTRMSSQQVLHNWNNHDPVLANNILETEDQKLHFIDPEYRPFNLKKPIHLLNYMGDWITKKMLEERERNL